MKLQENPALPQDPAQLAFRLQQLFRQTAQQVFDLVAQARDIGRLLYYQAGWQMNQGLRTTREVSLAKWTKRDDMPLAMSKRNTFDTPV